jgi:tetratricopeptide (TPR) repeat protein
MPADLPDFDKLWDYSDAAGTEQRFQGFLAAAESSGDVSYVAQLLTQIARAQGLQDRFDDAHATLDLVESMLRADGDLALATVRYLLERGRVFNSSGNRAAALPLFRAAAERAKEAGLVRYEIDAIHMIAIAEPDPLAQVRWNLAGIELALAHPGQRGWLWSLYNNLGESYGALGDHEHALETFEKLAAFQTERHGEPDVYTLKDQSRMLRRLGRVDRAGAIISPVHERLRQRGEPDGWISEEYAECLLASGDAAAAKPHFAAAHELLSRDPWVLKNDPAKLDRLKRLAAE